MVVDGKEQCHQNDYKIIGKPYFSPDSSHIAYFIKGKGKNSWHLVVDGHILPGDYGGFMKATPIIYDSPNHFHTIAMREPGPEFLLIEVEIPENVELETEINSK